MYGLVKFFVGTAFLLTTVFTFTKGSGPVAAFLTYLGAVHGFGNFAIAAMNGSSIAALDLISKMLGVNLPSVSGMTSSVDMSEYMGTVDDILNGNIMPK